MNIGDHHLKWSDMSTLDLINAIKLGEVDSHLDDLIQLASRNKILLYFLRVLDIYNDDRRREEDGFKYFMYSLKEVNDVLRNSNYEYSFFKLYKPITYVPADIDILISVNDVTKVAKHLIRYGYKLNVLEPYTITLTKDKTICLFEFLEYFGNY